eukprot:4876830-Pleurochrysis_carterae.AAC.1
MEALDISRTQDELLLLKMQAITPLQHSVAGGMASFVLRCWQPLSSVSSSPDVAVSLFAVVTQLLGSY